MTNTIAAVVITLNGNVYTKEYVDVLAMLKAAEAFNYRIATSYTI